MPPLPPVCALDLFPGGRQRSHSKRDRLSERDEREDRALARILDVPSQHPVPAAARVCACPTPGGRQRSHLTYLNSVLLCFCGLGAGGSPLQADFPHDDLLIPVGHDVGDKHARVLDLDPVHEILAGVADGERVR